MLNWSSDQSIVTFMPNRKFIFDPETSCDGCDDKNDTFVTVNIPLLVSQLNVHLGLVLIFKFFQGQKKLFNNSVILSNNRALPCMGLGSRFRKCFSIILVIVINYLYFISLIICLLVNSFMTAVLACSRLLKFCPNKVWILRETQQG